jgi:hypothetical protein
MPDHSEVQVEGSLEPNAIVYTRYSANVPRSEEILPSHQESLTPVETKWREILAAHEEHILIGERGPMSPGSYTARQEGMLYVRKPASGQIVVILASSLETAIYAFNGAGHPDLSLRDAAIWVEGSRASLIETSPLLERPTNALTVGRPILIRGEDDWRRAPDKAGIYRIHLLDEENREQLYIGRTSDFRARPRRHEKIAGRLWGVPGGIKEIELLPVKGGNTNLIGSSVDIDKAEERLIARAKQRECEGGPKVLNLYGGRNGPPSRHRAHWYIWPPEIEADDLEDSSPADSF